MKHYKGRSIYCCGVILAVFFYLTLQVSPAGAAADIPHFPGGINTGGVNAFTSTGGTPFEADYGRTGGVARASSGEILNTDNDLLYHSRMVARRGEDVIYRLTPPEGITAMQILGHFNEHFHQSAGARLIDVQIRCPGSSDPWNTGVMAEQALDIYQITGNKNAALVRNWGEVDVSGGEIEIILSASSASPDAALISAIEFATVIPPSPQISISELPSGIDSGASMAYTTHNGVPFEADEGSSNGMARNSSGEILGTDDDPFYHSRLVVPPGASMTYRITPPEEVTKMQILGHFNEHFHQSAGKRLINVFISCPGSIDPYHSGVRVEKDLDIFSEAGGRNTALVRNWGIFDVSGDLVEVAIWASSAESSAAAMISAIEFAAVQEPPSPPGAPAPPELLSPEEGAHMDNGCPDDNQPADPIIWDFSWSNVTDADKYQLAILMNGTVRVTQTVTAAEFRYICFPDSDEIPNCQIDSGNWTWRVRAASGENWGSWSNERFFDIDDEPNCLTSDAYGFSKVEFDPPSPALLTPGSEITLNFMYWAPYEIGAHISVIPHFEGKRLPQAAYQATTDEWYSDGYNGGEGQAYLVVNEEGMRVDEIRIEMEYDIIEYFVDYHFTSDSPGN